MARMPGAIWKPLAANWASQPRMRAYDFFCLHTMVGGLDGTDGFFRNANGIGYGGTESHFGVGPDGTIYQWQDTDFQADANGNGNWHVISSENADTGSPFPKWGGSDVPAFTPQQIEANARIAVWLYRTHGIPLDLTPDSRPGRRGLAVHRWGVPGYMVAGAEQWSTSQGKACPGDRRVAQAPLISARSKQILNGDDMPLNDEDKRAVEDRAYVGVLNAIKDMNNSNQPQARGAFLGLLSSALAPLQGQIEDLAAGPQQTAAGNSQLIDPAAVAAALVASPEFVDAIGESVAAKIANRLAS